MAAPMMEAIGRLFLLLSLSCSAGLAASPAALSEQALVGTWECGPTILHGPDFELVVSERTTRQADGRYTGLTISVITPQGVAPVTNRDAAEGLWRLEGDVLVSTVQRVRFLSSSDPAFSHALGQRILDAEREKKSVYRSRILAFDGTIARAIPVDSLYEAAEVESTCRRL